MLIAKIQNHSGPLHFRHILTESWIRGEKCYKDFIGAIGNKQTYRLHR